MRVWFVIIFSIIDRHRVLVINIVFCLIFIIVFSCSSTINNFYWPSFVNLLYFIECLLNDVLLKVFYLLIICQECEWAGSEHYVQTHITEPPCFLSKIKLGFFRNRFHLMLPQSMQESPQWSEVHYSKRIVFITKNQQKIIKKWNPLD